jgi:hypothetical protein
MDAVAWGFANWLRFPSPPINRTCGFPASSLTGFTARHTERTGAARVCSASFSPSAHDTAIADGSGPLMVFAGSSPITSASPSLKAHQKCSGFTRVMARRIAQPPKAAFVTSLQPFRLPGRAARQLPEQSTTLWVKSSSTSVSCLRGALQKSRFSHRGPTSERNDWPDRLYHAKWPSSLQKSIGEPRSHDAAANNRTNR